MRERNKLETTLNNKDIITLLETRLNEYKLNKSTKSFNDLWNQLDCIDGYEVEYNIINDKDILHYSFSLWNGDELVKTYETEMELV